MAVGIFSYRTGHIEHVNDGINESSIEINDSIQYLLFLFGNAISCTFR